MGLEEPSDWLRKLLAWRVFELAWTVSLEPVVIRLAWAVCVVGIGEGVHEVEPVPVE